MAIKFKLGTAVKQIVPAPVEGVVSEAVIIDGEVHFVVKWTDAAGLEQSRSFGEDQIEAAAVA